MLSKEEIKELSLLARVGLREENIEKYQKDLSDILEYFEKMEELDTENVEPIEHITGMKNVMRIDRREDFGQLGKEDIINNAPDKKDGQIKVKSVL